MAKRDAYKDFLKAAINLPTVRCSFFSWRRRRRPPRRNLGGGNLVLLTSSQKAPCENQFRAIEQAMLVSKACDVTGIVAIACARHGCFAPNSLSDLFAGEQQRNVDHAFLQALATTNTTDIDMVMMIYDIACQYFVRFEDRVGEKLPKGLTVDAAIGLMHVHGHKEDCFFRFASSFIPGAAIVAGEILESLWSVLNTISPMTRTSTLAHRAEILDDHMNDSNWKKLLNMRKLSGTLQYITHNVVTAAALCKKFENATDMKSSAEQYYTKQIQGIQPLKIATWESEIQQAEERRLMDRTAMDILKARPMVPSVGPAAADKGDPRETFSNSTSVENWIQMGLEIEEKQ